MIRKDEIYRIDYVLVFTVMLLVLIGVLIIYSAGFDAVEKINKGLYKKQLLWFIFGFVLMLVVTFMNYKFLSEYSLQIYIGFLLILLFTTIFGKTVRNTRAWLNLGLFAIQPSEFMKLGLVILLAKYLEFRERDIKNFRELLIPTLITFVPVIIILKQPDFGTAMMFVPILFTLLFVGGADVSHLASIIGIAAIALVVPMVITYREWVGQEGSNIILDFFKDSTLLYLVSGVLLFIAVASYAVHFFFIKKYYRKIYIPATVFSLGLLFSVIIHKYLKVYQKRRILVFLNPDLDPLGSGYNIIQSKIAAGSGGFFGKGFLNGSQAQLGFLPEKTSDFIFSVVAEEWGFVGSLLIIVLLAVIIFRGIQIALESKDKFGALVASGITSIFFYHVIINIGMAIGIMPVTGLPLCFISYGGSNLIMSMVAIGILINIRMRKFVH
jgi:rod shape determining protein RodA